PRRAVAERDQHVPQRQAVLAARHRDQHRFVGIEHALLGDGPLDLALEVEDEAGTTEAGVVLAQLDLGGRFAAGGLYRSAPPGVAERTSITSSASSMLPSGTSSSPRITIAVPGRKPSSRNTSAARRRPAISNCLRCGRTVMCIGSARIGEGGGGVKLSAFGGL